MSDVLSGLVRGLAHLLEPLLPAKWRPVAKKLEQRPLPTPAATVQVPVDPTVANLDKVEHIVVLMLENRSFDHMLGYLTLAGRGDVDGLHADFANDCDGSSYPVHHLTQTAFTGEAEDPCHSGACVDQQLSGGNGGFVASFAAYLAGLSPAPSPMPDLGLPMGYYDADELPSTTTSRASSASATAGSAPCRGRPGPTASTRPPAAPTVAVTTSTRRSTTS
jgi:hypothetical protein